MYGRYDNMENGYGDNEELIKELSIQNLISIMHSPAWNRVGEQTQEQMINVLVAYAKGSVKKAYEDITLNPEPVIIEDNAGLFR